MKKSSKTILVIVAIVLLIGIVVGTYFLVKNKQVTNKKTNELKET